MAGLFEETGRFAAFQLLRRSGKGGTPQDALIYGAGHGGMEAVLLVGLTNVSNLLLSFWLNTGTLEQHMGQLDDAAAQALAAAVAAPPHTYLWGGLERIVAVAIHISLSVLVWRAVERRASLWLFPAAIALHAGVDACAILAAAPYAPGGGGAGGAGLGCGPGRAGTVDLAAEREKIFMK